MTSDAAEQENERPSKAKVFISYSRKDMAFADRLEAGLKARGFTPLIDRTEIHAFEDWWKRIEELIAQADTVVFVLSPDSIASEVVRREVEFAASLNKRFAPILCRPVDDKAVPDVLARLNFINFVDDARFDASADRLTEALGTDIDWIRRHTEFGEQARRWSLVGQPNGLLLRSPVLEEAEQWIAARPEGAPAPTEETQNFVRESRRAATRRRNVLTGSLAAGLVVALALAGIAYWQRGIAQTNEAIAKDERDRAERNFGIARQTADGLVFDIAHGLRNVIGMPSDTVRRILETAKGTFEKLSSSAPDDARVQRSRAVMLDEFGQTYKALGNLDAALEFYRRGLVTAERLAALAPGNTEWQRDLSISQEKIGDVLLAQGKIGEAIKAFRDSLAIRERLAKAQPDNVQWQRDLAVAYHKIGEALVSGDLDAALKAYRDSLAITERLAAADPTNAQWQRDLASAHEKVGDVLLAQGQLDDALKSFRASLAATERLVAVDRNNMQWQRGLSVSYVKIGDVLKVQGRLGDALKSFRDSFAVMQRLVSLDRSNADWQRDLAIAYERIGDVLMLQDKRDEALEAYRNGLAIIEPLAAANPGYAEWQRALSVSYDRLGDVLKEQEKLDEALKFYRDGLAIRQRLAAAQPANARWQHDLYISHAQIGDVLETQGKLDEALKSYRDSLATIEPLAAANPSDAEWQRDLAIVHANIGDVLRAQRDLDAALAAYRSSLAIRQRLAALNHNNAQWQRDLQVGINRIAGLAFRFVRAGKFETALAAADQSIALNPEDVSFYAIRAYALMFLDRVHEARALFLRYRGTQKVLGDKPWEAVVLEDFADLRNAGHSHPLMEEIEKRFAAGG